MNTNANAELQDVLYILFTILTMQKTIPPVAFKGQFQQYRNYF